MPRWVVFLVVAVATRALTFGNPIVHVDEEFYFVTARAMLHGAVPYVDIWDRKPVGLFLLYMLPAALGRSLGIWAYQALALASVTATAVQIARLADRAGWAAGALAAGIAYLVWLNLLEGEGGQTPVFYNLLMVTAAALLAPRADDPAAPTRRVKYGMVAFALVGLALQIKYSVLFEGLFFGLWWLWRELRLSRSVVQAVAISGLLAGVAVLPTLAAWGWFAAHGYGDAFTYANFRSIGQRVPDPLLDQLGNLAIMMLLLSPLASLVVLAARAPSEEEPARSMRTWLFVWAVVATLGVLVFGSYFDHYGLPLLVPFAACAAGFFANHRRAARATVPLLAGIFLVGQILLVAKLHGRGTPGQFRAIVRQIEPSDGAHPGCLYVYSGTPMFYAFTDRCALTRYRFPSHLGRVRERGAIGVDQQAEVERIMAQRPEIVVLGPRYRGERPDMRAVIKRLLASGYVRRADLPLGNSRIAVYARR